jgi:putative ABC transport system permease protein
MVDISINIPVLVFTLFVSISVGISLGLVPVVQASKISLSEIMKENGSTLTSWRTRRISSALVITEVALSLILLIGSGLLIRSFLKVQKVEPGFDPQNIWTSQFVMQGINYQTEQQNLNFEKSLIEKVSSLPGVESVAITTGIPLSGKYANIRFTVEGRPTDFGQVPFGPTADVTPDYFKVMKIPLLKGRLFTDQDRSDTKKVVIINQKMAEEYFPGQDPIGKRITRGAPDVNETPEWSEIVGVVGNVKVVELKDQDEIQIYYPAYQYAGEDISKNVFLAVRTSITPNSIATSTRQIIQKLDKDLPIFNTRTLEEVISDSLNYSRFLIILLSVFASVALLLAIVGIYGVISYSVAQRTHELGIRIALGAQTLDIMKMVLKEGMGLTCIGIIIGFVSSLGVTQLLKTALYEITTTDPITYIAIIVTLLLVALLAIYIPASRATNVDPMVALRRE